MRTIAIALLLAAATAACRVPPSALYARGVPARAAAERDALAPAVLPAASARATSPSQETDESAPAATSEADLVREVLARTPRIEAALLRWQEAAARVDVVTEYPDPVLRVAVMPDPIETRLGPTNARVGLMQRIPWPGRLEAAGAMQAAQAEALRLGIRQATWKVATEARVAYADLLDIDEDTALLEAELTFVESWRDIVRTRLELGRARTSDMVQLDVRAERLREDIRANADRRRAVLGRINALRSRPADTPLVPRQPTLPRVEDEVESLLAVAAERNPDVERLRHLARAAGAGIRLADLNRYTDPTVGVEYTFIDEGPLRQFSDNGDDAVGLSVSIPLPIRRRGRAAERAAARLRLAAVKRDEAAALDRIRGEIALALHGLREARTRRQTSEASVLPLVERQIEIGLEEYATGRSSMTDLLTWETQRLMVLQTIRRSRTKAAREMARLEHALGLRLAPPPTPPSPPAPPAADDDEPPAGPVPPGDAPAGAGDDDPSSPDGASR